MTSKTFLALLASFSFALAAGCPATPVDPPGIDAPAGDVGAARDTGGRDGSSIDVNAGDALLDASAVDVGLDGSAADVGLDASAADVGLDASAADVGLDASAADVGLDASAADVGVDAGAADVGMDARATDVGIDAPAPDTGVDAPSPVDAGNDAPCASGCGLARDCCGGRCVNLTNDPTNCGACGLPCGAGTYCMDGSCVPIPCTTTCGGGALCCAGACCGAGQICCEGAGPVMFLAPLCMDPDSSSGTCPAGCAPACACLSPETPIATPTGERPVGSLRAGDLVYSVERGARVVVPILDAGRSAAVNHHVVRVVLANGRTLEASPWHPTADGRTFADLAAGAHLSGVAVVSVELAAYSHAFTYDILPDSESGTYYAAGVLIGSTLHHAAALSSAAYRP